VPLNSTKKSKAKSSKVRKSRHWLQESLMTYRCMHKWHPAPSPTLADLSASVRGKEWATGTPRLSSIDDDSGLQWLDKDDWTSHPSSQSASDQLRVLSVCVCVFMCLCVSMCFRESWWLRSASSPGSLTVFASVPSFE
jgi:hypothetical protein